MSGESPATRGRLFLLVTLLFGSGTLHFVRPKFYDAIVPPVLPGSARMYTYLSGVAELVIAAALTVPRTRRLGGLLATLLFIAIFPANVQFTVDSLGNPKAGLPIKLVSVLRLPLQVPLVTSALKIRRAA